MLQRSQRLTREDLVVQWQQPIYSYLVRMVRDPELAADLTQEVFTRALTEFDRIRDPEPWLYRVAANLVRERGRRDRAREQRERRVAVTEVLESDRDDLDAEALSCIECELHSLPSEQRSLLLLHYYGGLSQRAIASTLELPRTTVADRLRAALDALRQRLHGAGHAALVPFVESSMCSAPAVSVPECLSNNLASLVTSSTVSSSTSLGLAGFVVSQKLLVITTAVALVTFIAGWGTKAWFAGSTLATATDEAAEQRSRLEQERDGAIDHTKQLESELESLRERSEDLEKRLADTEARAEAQSKIVPVSATEDGSSDTAGLNIDWDGLRALTAESRGVLFAIADLVESGSGSRGLSPELQASRRVLLAELEKVAALVRLESDQPMLDERFFPQIMDTYLAAFLDLDSDQRSALMDLSRDAVSRIELSDSITPIELHGQRRELIAGVSDRFLDRLTPEQRDNFRRLDPIWSQIRDGSTRKLDIGVDRSDLGVVIGREWMTQFGLTSDQRPWAEREVADYVERARTLLATTNLDTVSDSERVAFDSRVRDLQLEFERKILAQLTDEQRAAAIQRMPSIFRFTTGGNTNINTNRAPGF